MEEKNELDKDPITESIEAGVCPDCGATLRYESGCMYCYQCGWAACGN